MWHTRSLMQVCGTQGAAQPVSLSMIILEARQLGATCFKVSPCTASGGESRCGPTTTVSYLEGRHAVRVRPQEPVTPPGKQLDLRAAQLNARPALPHDAGRLLRGARVVLWALGLLPGGRAGWGRRCGDRRGGVLAGGPREHEHH